MQGAGSLYARVKGMVGSDLLQIFGFSGSGKTTFALKLSEDASRYGRVLYVDTEMNMKEKPRIPGLEYCSFDDFDSVYHSLRQLLSGSYRLVVVDSIGLPMLAKLAELRMDERGLVFQKAVNMVYRLKSYASLNDCLVLVTNQPESEFAKKDLSYLEPFGGKTVYAFKEVWYSRVVSRDQKSTICVISSFRSRIYPYGRELFRMEIGDTTRILPGM